MHVTRHFRPAALLAAIAAIVAVSLTLAGCGAASNDPGDKHSEPAPEPTGAIRLVASVNQWGSLAAQIGGEDVEVTSILSSTGVDAHDFEPRTADMAALSKADVVLVNGAGYDAWASKSLSKTATLVSAADIMGAMEGDNPHLWFSKDARRAVAKELADVFAKARPKKEKAFEQRLKAWQDEEDELDQTMTDFAAKHKDTPYAATEAVATYLMADLGLKDVTPTGYAQAVASEGEVAPADLQDFQTLLEDHGASLLINNPQEASDTTNMITGTAGRASVPVIDVSEQMPEGQDTLVGWISSLVEDVLAKLGETQDEQTPSNEGQTDPEAPADPATDAGETPSNEGQSDPGK